MNYFFIPYLLQLLCVIHIFKARRNTYWVWVVVMLPYVGGLAYLIIEILPDLASPHRVNRVKDSVLDVIRPNQRFEVTRQKARFSPTHRNMVDYADALLDRGEYDEALKIYQDQNAGAFLNDPELLYRIAAALYACGRYPEALAAVESLMKRGTSYQNGSRENILYLSIIEKTESAEFAKKEYARVLQRIQDNTIELPYIEFLMRNNDEAALGGIFARIHEDEQSMRVNNIRYNRRFYKKVYAYERDAKRRKV